MMAGESKRGGLVTKIVVTYRLADDPTAGERTLILSHEGGGAEVDGLVWSDALMAKLVYRRDADYVAATRAAGRDAWKVEGVATSETGGECVWLHRPDCVWEEYCPDV